MSSLGQAIRDARNKLKLTQIQLADDMGVSRAALTQWEGNVHRPTAERLSRLSQLLGCDLLAGDAAAAASVVTRHVVRRASPALQRDVSLVEAMSPLWRLGDVSVFRTQGIQKSDMDLYVVPDIAFRSSCANLAPRAMAISGIVVDGESLRPTFDHGALLLFAGGGSAVAGDLVFILGRMEDSRRPGRFGRLIDRSDKGISICRQDMPLELPSQSPEYEVMFRVIRDA